MPVATTESLKRNAMSDPCQPPATRPVLPVVLLSDEHPRLRVFYVEQEAIAAAHECPQDACFDIRGRALECVWGENGAPCMEASTTAGGDDVRSRVVQALSATANRPGLDQAVADELHAILPWIADAPGLASMVSALGFGPVAYNTAYTCQEGCSAAMRANPHTHPPCCPR
jgi:hypothetical protein